MCLNRCLHVDHLRVDVRQVLRVILNFSVLGMFTFAPNNPWNYPRECYSAKEKVSLLLAKDALTQISPTSNSPLQPTTAAALPSNLGPCEIPFRAKALKARNQSSQVSTLCIRKSKRAMPASCSCRKSRGVVPKLPFFQTDYILLVPVYNLSSLLMSEVPACSLGTASLRNSKRLWISVSATRACSTNLSCMSFNLRRLLQFQLSQLFLLSLVFHEIFEVPPCLDDAVLWDACRGAA